MKRLRHTDDPECRLCLAKLEECHPLIRFWFSLIKVEFPDCHVSDGFRNEEQQRDCVERGTSQLKWPNSLHNKMVFDRKLERDVPQSEAMDLFQLNDEYPKGRWDRAYFFVIWEFLREKGAPIDWGGNFRRRKDYPHFEIREVERG